jgi:hypothetical protein
MAKKRSNPEKYKAQAFRTANNKKKAWQKHIEKNPNDKKGKDIIETLLKTAK